MVRAGLADDMEIKVSVVWDHIESVINNDNAIMDYSTPPESVLILKGLSAVSSKLINRSMIDYQIQREQGILEDNSESLQVGVDQLLIVIDEIFSGKRITHRREYDIIMHKSNEVVNKILQRYVWAIINHTKTKSLYSAIIPSFYVLCHMYKPTRRLVCNGQNNLIGWT